MVTVINYQTTFHILRHTFVAMNYMEELNILQLTKMMRHEKTSTTERYANANRGIIAILNNDGHDIHA